MPMAELRPLRRRSPPPTLSLGSDAVVSVSDTRRFCFGYSSETRSGVPTRRCRAGRHAGKRSRPGFGRVDAARSPSPRSATTGWCSTPARGMLDLDGRLLDLSSLIEADEAARCCSSPPTDGGRGVSSRFAEGIVSRAGRRRHAAELRGDGQSGFPAAPVVPGRLRHTPRGPAAQAWRSLRRRQRRNCLRPGRPCRRQRLAWPSLRNGDRSRAQRPPRRRRLGRAGRRRNSSTTGTNSSSSKEDQQEVEENDPDVPPEGREDQLPPVAVDDAFGARPGPSSILPVLLNDYDPNGDVLVISDIDADRRAVGTARPGDANRQQVQLTLAPSARGTFSFRYTISDGRGGTANATVTVTVRAERENSPPRAGAADHGARRRGRPGRPRRCWATGSIPTATRSISPRRPSRRPTRSATSRRAPSSSSRAAAPAAQRSVTLVVSDGTAEGSSGSMSRHGEEARRGADRRRAVRRCSPTPGRRSPSARSTTCAAAAGSCGSTQRAGEDRLHVSPPSLEAGTFTFTSDQVRTHYLEYVVTDGDADRHRRGPRRRRRAAGGEHARPITVPKTIFVNTLSSETIDVAATDIDPAGGVLLVTGVYNIPQQLRRAGRGARPAGRSG